MNNDAPRAGTVPSVKIINLARAVAPRGQARTGLVTGTDHDLGLRIRRSRASKR